MHWLVFLISPNLPQHSPLIMPFYVTAAPGNQAFFAAGNLEMRRIYQDEYTIHIRSLICGYVIFITYEA